MPLLLVVNALLHFPIQKSQIEVFHLSNWNWVNICIYHYHLCINISVFFGMHWKCHIYHDHLMYLTCFAMMMITVYACQTFTKLVISLFKHFCLKLQCIYKSCFAIMHHDYSVCMSHFQKACHLSFQIKIVSNYQQLQWTHFR